MKVETILRKKTCGLFSNDWYLSVSDEIEKSLEGDGRGYIYFISNGYSHHVKIGFSRNINTRLKSFKSSFKNGVYLHGFIYSNNCEELEKEIHKKLHERLISSEWFSLNPDIIKSTIDEYSGVQVSIIVNNRFMIAEGMPNNTQIRDKTALEEDVFNYLDYLPRNERIEIHTVRKKLKEEFEEINHWSDKKIFQTINRYSIERDIELVRGRSKERWIMFLAS